MLLCPGHAIPLIPVLVMIGDMLTSFLLPLVVMNQIPPGDQLRHVIEIQKTLQGSQPSVLVPFQQQGCKHLPPPYPCTLGEAYHPFQKN